MFKSIQYLLSVTLPLVVFISCSQKLVVAEKKNPEGTALVVIGAASRISQETALIERLYEEGELDNLQLVAGVSAGALNAVIIDGVKEGRISFKEVRSILFQLKEDDIFINPNHHLPVDLSPFDSTLRAVYVETMGYSSIKEIQLPTIISTVDKKRGQLVRITNIDGFRMNDQVTTNLVEVLKATSAMPHVFPHTIINDRKYIDGGTKEDIPIEAVLEYERFRNQDFEKIIVIGIQRNKTTNWETEMDLLELRGLEADVLKKMLEDMHYNMDKKDVLKDKMTTFYKQHTKELTDRIFIYTPNIKGFKYVPIVGFNDQEYQYKTVYQWSKTNHPIQLKHYLDGFKKVSRLHSK
ncbi:patatin-like phospholipase family protein [Flammeovirga agarivorans]|uniref:PNPLA domain-containing protein n=1 Tax=Flammeovirga agarivorans TaxID=2726742 RepID=A0A7X8SQ90_9BACT|nr:patatin-like phospholipase family protein [Flammeovirga agarivorans]NLR94345.1 hypothetical protein [Flammeovirga agarivorans]